MTYKCDSGSNRRVTRFAGFSKRFRWFNTEYRFSEIIEKQIPSGYSVKNYLNEDELHYFYSPESLKYIRENGPDSLKFRALADTIDKKVEKWISRNLVSSWIDEFTGLIAGKGGNDISRESLKSREEEFIGIIEKDEPRFDSLWTNGVILANFIGKASAIKYKTEADSAITVALNTFLMDFKEYSVRIVMPGKLTRTNGFLDSSRILMWPVKSDYFLTDKYEMWAESKIPNIWAWCVSGIFLAFVMAGLIVKIKRG